MWPWRTSIGRIKNIINSATDFNQDSYIVKASGKKILTEAFTTIAEYYQPFKDALKKKSSEVLEEIKTSNVRGRGGAGFPMGMKLEFCRNVENKTKKDKTKTSEAKSNIKKAKKTKLVKNKIKSPRTLWVRRKKKL